MSLSISFIGKFSNGRTRAVGSFVKTNGLNNSQLYLTDEDINFINRVAEGGKNSFNWNLQNNKFKEVLVIADYDGKEIYKHKLILPLKRLDKQLIRYMVEKVNKQARKTVISIFNKTFLNLSKERQEKVFNKWCSMNPQKEDMETEFEKLVSDNSRVDNYNNIIFYV